MQGYQVPGSPHGRKKERRFIRQPDGRTIALMSDIDRPVVSLLVSSGELFTIRDVRLSLEDPTARQEAGAIPLWFKTHIPFNRYSSYTVKPCWN